MQPRHSFEIVSNLLYTDDDEYFADGFKILCRDNNLRTAYTFKLAFGTRQSAEDCLRYYNKNGLENRLELDWIEVYAV